MTTVSDSFTTPDLLRQVKLIEIQARRLASQLLVGTYRSVFHGWGLEFLEVRDYQPGDDIRSIDWNVTARMGHPYVKNYVEEREQSVLLMVDGSSSLTFASHLRSKRRTAIDVCALLALSAHRNNDRVGMVLFSETVEHFVPPRKGGRQVLRLIRDLVAWRPAHQGTNIARALEFVNRWSKKRGIVFLISDLIDEGWPSILRVVARKHDVVVVVIVDPRETDLPALGLIALEDAETGQQRLVDSSDRRVRQAYTTAVHTRRDARRRLLAGMQVDGVEISTAGSCATPLRDLFLRRARRP